MQNLAFDLKTLILDLVVFLGAIFVVVFRVDALKLAFVFITILLFATG